MILGTFCKLENIQNQTILPVKPQTVKKQTTGIQTVSMSLLIDELLVPNLKQRLHRLVKILENRSWDGDISQFRTISRTLLQER